MGAKQSAEVEPYDGAKSGIETNRKCHDVLCCLLLIAWWVGMAAAAFIGWTYGDVARLTYGPDYRGTICGGRDSKCGELTIGGVKYTRKCSEFLTFPRVMEDIQGNIKNGVTNPMDMKFYGLCAPNSDLPASTGPDYRNCPAAGQWVCSVEGEEYIGNYFSDVGVAEWCAGATTSNQADFASGAKPCYAPAHHSALATAQLESCLIQKNNAGPLGAYLLTGVCSELMQNCWKTPADERDIFFRCIPKNEANSTCFHSEILEHRAGKSLDATVGELKCAYDTPRGSIQSFCVYGTKVTVLDKSCCSLEDATVAGRCTAVATAATTHTCVANDFECGKCLDPPYMEDGVTPMMPGAKECKSRKIKSLAELTMVQSNPVFDAVNTWTQTITEWIGDLNICMMEIIVSSLGVSMVLGVLWMILLRYCASIFVWTTLWAIIIFCILLTIQMFVYGEVITVDWLMSIFSSVTAAVNDATQSNITSAGDAAEAAASVSAALLGVQLFDAGATDKSVYEILGWVMLVVTIIIIVLVVWMRTRIKIAIQIIKEASKAVGAMPLIMLFPFWTMLFTVVLIAYWAYVQMLLASSGSLQDLDLGNLTAAAQAAAGGRRLVSLNGSAAVADVAMKELANLDMASYLGLYHFFGFLWTNQFIDGIGLVTIAGAIGSWYWAPPPGEKDRELPRAPVLEALGRTFRYHLGSIAFGACIIAIIQFIRAILAYLDKQTQGIQKANPVIRVLFKVVQCCLWCFEKLVKWISRNAYIYIAIKGTSFCTSTFAAVKLIILNVARMATAAAISTLVIVIGELVIVVGSSVFCWFFVSKIMVRNVTSVAVPVVVNALLSFFVSRLFMGVYGMAMDTILLSFCMDEAENDGSAAKPFYMNEELRKIINKKNKADGDSSSDKPAAVSKKASAQDVY